MRPVFRYKHVKGEGDARQVHQRGIFLDEISSYGYQGDSLYLYLKQTYSMPTLVPSPVKGKITKDNPNGWHTELEKRVVEEPLTVEITEKEDIDRWEEIMTKWSIF